MLKKPGKNDNYQLFLAIFLCFIFFVAYAVLSIVRFDHYGAFGFDLGLRDQVVWEYSRFQAPITTIHFYPFKNILTDHVEPFYVLVSVFYWLWSSPKIILLVEAFFVCFSGIAIYLLAKKKSINYFVCLALVVSYLAFYGVQQAMWFDVHSASFAAGSLSWLIYFLQKRNTKWIIITFILAISTKENVASLTFLIFLVWFIKTKSKTALYLMGASIAYLFFIFGIYFPHLTVDGYRYKNEGGLASNLINISSFYDTPDKRQVLFYTSAWFGFLPLLNPLMLIPALGDLWSYFVVASNLKAAQGLFMHYRITLAPLMMWATIFTISKYRRLNNNYIGIYLLVCVIFFQYTLHLPLSYLAKEWFWREPSGVKNINKIITYLPKNATVVSQNNITPHISQRKMIFTLWPERKSFESNSPCGEPVCDWFRWAGDPEYLIIDTSPEWDIRHLLANRDEYMKGLENFRQVGIIKKYKQEKTAVLYKILKNPI